METIDEGHKYQLQDNGSGEHSGSLIFFKDSLLHGGEGYAGTTNQEVIRALIDRVKYLEKELSSPYNSRIIQHLRQALALHECRHIERIVYKNGAIENVKVADNGHFVSLIS